MSMLSHVCDGDGVVETMLAMARCCYRVMLVTTLLSHASDGVAETTWLRCDIDVESC
jgi:hypothetical protein